MIDRGYQDNQGSDTEEDPNLPQYRRAARLHSELEDHEEDSEDYEEAEVSAELDSEPEQVISSKRARSDTVPSSTATRKKSRQELRVPPVPVLTSLGLSTSRRAAPAALSTSMRASPPIEETSIPASLTREIKVPARQSRLFEISKSFLSSLVFTKVPWPATTEAELDLCDTAWTEARDSMTIQMRALGALKPDQHVYNLPAGPSMAIDSISRGLVSLCAPYSTL